MYSEKTYKNYIFWIQVKRIVLIILTSCIGAALGILIGKILETAIQTTSYNNAIIAISTIIFFLLSLLFTTGTGKQVQDGYWRIAVLRKMTVIQKDLELNNELLKNTGRSVKSELSSIVNHEVDEEDEESGNIYDFSETSLVPQENKKAKKKISSKKVKSPEELKV